MNNRKRSFIVLAISFFLFSFFMSLMLNINHWENKLKESYFLTVELKGNVNEERANILENKLLKENEVRGVRYMTKDESFRNLQRELGIVIPKSDNALPNSLIIYFNNTNDIDKIQNFLEPEDSIKEIFVDSDFITMVESRIEVLKAINYIVLGITGAIGIMIYFAFKGFVDGEFYRLSLLNPNSNRNHIRAQNVNVLPFTGASLVGTLVFLNLYSFLREIILNYVPRLYLLTGNELLLTTFLILIGYNLFIWFTPMVLNRREK